jgi:hypothetical protein
VILVDTSVWIDLFKGNDSLESLQLQNLIANEEEIFLAEIILTEILQGTKYDDEFLQLRNYLLDFPVLSPKSIETFIDSAQIYRKCRRRGKTIRKTVDCIIAAVCIENDAAILHKDADFDAIAQCTGLQIVNASRAGTSRKKD